MTGAVYAFASSQLYIEGNVQFVENEGYDGGAIALYEQSEIILTYSMTTPHLQEMLHLSTFVRLYKSFQL